MRGACAHENVRERWVRGSALCWQWSIGLDPNNPVDIALSLSSRHRATVLMDFAREANCIVPSVSSALSDEGEMAAIMHVFALPPSDSCK